MLHGYSFVAPAFVALCLLWPAVPAAAQTLVIDSAACRLLERYRPEPGQDPTYRPGEDARGRPVAPADLGGGTALALPETYEFEVEVRPRDRGRLRDSRIAVGRVSVLPDGRLLWNGEPMDDARRVALLELCREQQE